MKSSMKAKPGKNTSGGTTAPEYEVVHTLGNLVLLTRRKNSAAQNYDFQTKKAKYFTSKGKGSAFVLTSQVILEPEWTPAVVQRRQPELLGRLKALWRL